MTKSRECRSDTENQLQNLSEPIRTVFLVGGREGGGEEVNLLLHFMTKVSSEHTRRPEREVTVS